MAPGNTPQYLHAQPYGAAVTTSGNADCEADQRGYPTRIARLAPPGNLGAIDPHTPGGTGPIFKTFDDRNLPPSQRQLGATHVPAGETFTRDPGGMGAPIP